LVESGIGLIPIMIARRPFLFDTLTRSAIMDMLSVIKDLSIFPKTIKDIINTEGA